MIPAERERAADELPMSSDSLVSAYLVLRPAQSMFDLFVALLDPHAQSIKPDDLFEAGWGKQLFAFHMVRWRGQIGHEIPGREVGQRHKAAKRFDSDERGSRFRLIVMRMAPKDMRNSTRVLASAVFRALPFLRRKAKRHLLWEETIHDECDLSLSDLWCS